MALNDCMYCGADLWDSDVNMGTVQMNRLTVHMGEKHPEILLQWGKDALVMEQHYLVRVNANPDAKNTKTVRGFAALQRRNAKIHFQTVFDSCKQRAFTDPKASRICWDPDLVRTLFPVEEVKSA